MDAVIMSATNSLAVTASAARRKALADLYEPDETAWLEESSRLIRAGQLDELDYENLASYLDDMARSDRREVETGAPGPKQEFKAEVIRPIEPLEVGPRLFKITPASR